ncbi:hypothetical protein C8R45DRAFT_562212 [Mycena sanguinolenta]|nr:hypothetical protein C8R45DRAFT_562212 [Mycena sanguinolenta]
MAGSECLRWRLAVVRVATLHRIIIIRVLCIRLVLFRLCRCHAYPGAEPWLWLCLLLPPRTYHHMTLTPTHPDTSRATAPAPPQLDSIRSGVWRTKDVYIMIR